jgi:hypothetical protein
MDVRMHGLFGQKKQEIADDCPNHGLFGQNKQEIADGCPNAWLIRTDQAGNC